MRKGVGIVLSLAAVAGIFLAAKVMASTKVDLLPGINGPLKYVGSAKLLPAALGECWNCIMGFSYLDPSINDYVTPQYPEEYVLEPGTMCYVDVSCACELINFKWAS